LQDKGCHSIWISGIRAFSLVERQANRGRAAALCVVEHKAALLIRRRKDGWGGEELREFP